ncbi:ester cyclase [Chitinophaga agrisoli]|uniref:Ester cyclase n=1 Tax=Chitinophaga agrisoli TaxID=2607653 RepID=A0A5B2VVS2_9BACT|nr:ester cyclase [Chitinophaga agrisoli]KAA2242780.1 ester cyclase [Chitinophaga agrisoli]
MKTIIKVITGLFLATTSINTQAQSAKATREVDSLRGVINQLNAANKEVSQYLAKFDTLDYTVFSNQQWARFHESHDQHIKVYWPDGHVTTGLPKHLEDMKALFVYAPDTRIKQHPIRFGSGNLTAVTGVFEGTFTKPMPIGNGKFIQPTRKSFKIPMATIGIWKNGVMIEEHLFWDNKAYLDQIGLGK